MKKTAFEIDLPAPGESVKLASGTDARQVGGFMAQLCRQLAADDKLTRRYAAIINQDPAANWPAFIQFVYSCVYFMPDPLNKQLLRTPAASLRDGLGNCVDYTIFLGSVATAAGLPVIIRLVKFRPESDFVHVYPIINGTAVDLVIGQNQDGSEKQKRRNKYFDHVGTQVNFYSMFDLII